MAVEVKKEPEDMGGPPYEHCCICDQPTPYWYEPNDVALCTKCAEFITKQKIPTKKEWLNKN